MLKGDEYENERRLMVTRQIEARGVCNPRVLGAMLAVPRHLFVSPELRGAAYDDRPLPIGHGQTISQPYIVALMTELLEIGPEDRVLEIGAGSGYQAAILGTLAHSVVSIERLPDIAELARENLARAEIANVEVICADGTLGCPERAPFDGIIITAASPEIPQPLIDQLADGGRIICPVGGREVQHLVKLVKKDGRIIETTHGGVCFVPLIGRYGWGG